MLDDLYNDISPEELEKQLTSNRSDNSSSYELFVKKIGELILWGDTHRVQKLLQPLLLIDDYEQLRKFYFISLATNTEKKEFLDRWMKELPHRRAYWRDKDLSIPAITACFMLGDFIYLPYLFNNKHQQNPWFIMAKKYLMSEKVKDPNDYDVLLLLLYTSSSPSEFLLFLKEIAKHGDSLFERDNKINQAIEWENDSSKHEPIIPALYRLLKENIIAEISDKKMAEEIIKTIYSPLKGNQGYMLVKWELLFYCQNTETGKIACIEEMFKIDRHNQKAKELNKLIGYKAPLILEQCQLCGCYTSDLKEGLCDNCYKQVDHSWYGDAMDTYRELSDPFDEGIDMFED